MTDWIHDLRYARRVLVRHSTASAVVVLTLGAGLGITATFFSFFYGMALRPLPFEEPETLVALRSSRPSLGTSWMSVSYPDLVDWRSQSQVLAGAEVYRGAHYNLRTESEPERVPGARVSAGLFPLLGVEPASGRLFFDEEGRPGADPVVLLGHDLWTRRFGGDPGIVGTSLRIDDRLHEVVGIMPPVFAFPNYGEMWTPITVDPSRADRSDRIYTAIGRLAPGVSIEGAQQALEPLAQRIAERYPESNRGWSARVRGLHDDWLPPVTKLAMLAQLSLAILVLGIVCANVINLRLAQASVRRREVAVRVALGAGRSRLVRQAMVESLALAAAGGGLGVLSALWAGDALVQMSAVQPPYWLVWDLDLGVLLFTAGVTVISGLGIGVVPALREADPGLSEELKAGGRGEVEAGGGRLRNALVVAELALALPIVVGALLMAKSFAGLERLDPGFATDGVLTAKLSLAGEAYVEPRRRALFAEELLRRVRSSDGVVDAGLVSLLPVSRSGYTSSFIEAEGEARPDGTEPLATVQQATSGYFTTLGIPVVTGRLFSDSEVREGAGAALVSRSLAEQLWPRQDPLGRRLRSVGGERGPWLDVVGVVEDLAPVQQLAGVDVWPHHQLYLPFGRDPGTLPSVVVDARDDPLDHVAAVRRAVAEVDPGVPLFDVFTMDQQLRRFYFAQHIWSRMASIVGAVALALAALGVYGVMAYSVSQRRRELGVRVALGARPGDLLRMVVGRGLLLATVGVAFGLAAAVALARSISSLLHEVSSTDPGVFLLTVVLALTAAALASYLPARRAAASDPMEALRQE